MRRSIAALALLAAAAAPAAGQRQTDTTLTVRAGGRIDLENPSGPVILGSWDRNEVRIRATHAADTRIEIDTGAGVVRVEPEARRGPAGHVRFEITVPRTFGVSVEAFNGPITVRDIDGEVEVEAMNGAIEVHGGRGRVDAESMNGRVLVVGARGRVSAYSGNSNVELRDIDGDIAAEAINGNLVIQQARSTRVTAETVNGSIRYEGAIRADGHYSFDTHNGSVRLAIPENAGASIRIESYSGSVESDFPMQFTTSRRDRDEEGVRRTLVIGNGSARIEITTFSGPVILRRGGTM